MLQRQHRGKSAVCASFLVLVVAGSPPVFAVELPPGRSQPSLLFELARELPAVVPLPRHPTSP
eukprot:10470583-Prorocentrum_lima.AAC.1